MEANCTNLTQKILRLTLEIIYLLTGEANIVAKKISGDGQESTAVPLCSLLFPERNHEKKILEVTKKIIDLLTGEVFHPYPAPEGPIINNAEVEFKNEEEEEEDVRDDRSCNLEEIQSEMERDRSSNGNPPERCPHPLYFRDSTQEDHTILHHHQVDGSSNGNPTERCPRLLYFRDSTQEGHTIPHHHQVDGSSNGNPPERCPRLLYLRDSTQEDHTTPHHHQVDGSSNGKPRERCPRPMYSRDSTQEGHTIPHHHQGRSWSNFNTTIKKEIKEEKEDSMMEEYLEGHKDLYKDVMMDNQPPLTSPDASGHGNPPERCPRPLYSRDSTQEDHTIPHHHQVDGSSNGNPPERCPRPLYSRDSTQEGHIIPHHHQEVEVIDMKIEVKKEEEMYVRGNQPSMKEPEMRVTITKEESSLDVSRSGGDGWNISGGHISLSRDEDNDMAQNSPGVRLFTQYIHHKFDCLERPADPFNCEESKTVILNVPPGCHGADGPPDPANPEECSSNNVDTVTKRDNKMFLLGCVHNTINHKVDFPFPCSECRKGFKTKRELQIHQMVHAGKEIYSCPDCQKEYMTHHGLMEHKKLHTGEKPYTCLKCEASFGLRSQLTAHQKVHYEQKPFSCSECRKSFITSQELILHQRAHTREKPFSCSECGKSFTDKSQLNRHHRVHTGEKPFFCPECGKCFSDKGNCDRHMRSHTSERPFSCSECGKCFKLKGALTSHQKSHHPNTRFW